MGCCFSSFCSDVCDILQKIGTKISQGSSKLITPSSTNEASCVSVLNQKVQDCFTSNAISQSRASAALNHNAIKVRGENFLKDDPRSVQEKVDAAVKHLVDNDPDLEQFVRPDKQYLLSSQNNNVNEEENNNVVIIESSDDEDDVENQLNEQQPLLQQNQQPSPIFDPHQIRWSIQQSLLPPEQQAPSYGTASTATTSSAAAAAGDKRKQQYPPSSPERKQTSAEIAAKAAAAEAAAAEAKRSRRHDTAMSSFGTSAAASVSSSSTGNVPVWTRGTPATPAQRQIVSIIDWLVSRGEDGDDDIQAIQAHLNKLQATGVNLQSLITGTIRQWPVDPPRPHTGRPQKIGGGIDNDTFNNLIAVFKNTRGISDNHMGIVEEFRSRGLTKEQVGTFLHACKKKMDIECPRDKETNVYMQGKMDEVVLYDLDFLFLVHLLCPIDGGVYGPDPVNLANGNTVSDSARSRCPSVRVYDVFTAGINRINVAAVNMRVACIKDTNSESDTTSTTSTSASFFAAKKKPSTVSAVSSTKTKKKKPRCCPASGEDGKQSANRLNIVASFMYAIDKETDVVNWGGTSTNMESAFDRLKRPLFTGFVENAPHLSLMSYLNMMCYPGYVFEDPDIPNVPGLIVQMVIMTTCVEMMEASLGERGAGLLKTAIGSDVCKMVVDLEEDATVIINRYVTSLSRRQRQKYADLTREIETAIANGTYEDAAKSSSIALKRIKGESLDNDEKRYWNSSKFETPMDWRFNQVIHKSMFGKGSGSVISRGRDLKQLRDLQEDVELTPEDELILESYQNMLDNKQKTFFNRSGSTVKIVVYCRHYKNCGGTREVGNQVPRDWLLCEECDKPRVHHTLDEHVKHMNEICTVPLCVRKRLKGNNGIRKSKCRPCLGWKK